MCVLADVLNDGQDREPYANARGTMGVSRHYPFKPTVVL